MWVSQHPGDQVPWRSEGSFQALALANFSIIEAGFLSSCGVLPTSLSILPSLPSTSQQEC